MAFVQLNVLFHILLFLLTRLLSISISFLSLISIFPFLSVWLLAPYRTFRETNERTFSLRKKKESEGLETKTRQTANSLTPCFSVSKSSQISFSQLFVTPKTKRCEGPGASDRSSNQQSIRCFPLLSNSQDPFLLLFLSSPDPDKSDSQQ